MKYKYPGVKYGWWTIMEGWSGKVPAEQPFQV
jgi:hypothetical protein